MDEKITTIKGRILQIANSKGFTNEKFCEKIGISYSNFKGKHKSTSIGSEYIATILTMFEDISPDWLILGKGEMYRSQYDTIDNSVNECPRCADKERIIEALKDTISKQDTIIMLITSEKK